MLNLTLNTYELDEIKGGQDVLNNELVFVQNNAEQTSASAPILPGGAIISA